MMWLSYSNYNSTELATMLQLAIEIVKPISVSFKVLLNGEL